MVSPVTFRRVPVLAKIVTTVDHISGGRVELGLGAGWYEAEHEAYGFAFPPLRERLDELDRQLAEIVRHWDDAPEIQPKPLQHPHPPIIVGGTAKPRTVRAAVAHADEYNTVWPTVDEARERKRAVDDAARAAGREPLRFSMMTSCVVADDDADLRERLAAFKALTGSDAPAISGTVDEVVARLREYEAGGRRARDAAAHRARGRRDGRRAGRRRSPTTLGACASSSSATPRQRPASRTSCGR